MNYCKFSENRKYRYLLKHDWSGLLEERAIAWIGLNPSTADESNLDPTLRRIKNFSSKFGFNCFYMLNLFAFRATNPKEMMKAEDPVGPENYSTIVSVSEKVDMVVACWGVDGNYRSQAGRVLYLLLDDPVYCLGENLDGTPKHPLYVPGKAVLEVYEEGGCDDWEE